MNQEQLIQLQIIEQEAQQLEQQLQLVEQQISELQNLNDGLDELQETKEKEILAELGRGIYIPAEIKSKKLIVEVGRKNFVKKSIPDTKKIIDEQIGKLNQVKIQINNRVEELRKGMNTLAISEKEEKVDKKTEDKKNK